MNFRSESSDDTQGAPEGPIKTRNGKMSHSVIHRDETRLVEKKNPLRKTGNKNDTEKTTDLRISIEDPLTILIVTTENYF